MSDWHHHLSPFPCVPSCSTNPFTTISASCACSPSLACCFTDSMVTRCLYSTCSSSSLLLQRSTMKAQDLSSCLLASNPPLHVEASSWLCLFQLQICLFFFNSFISLSEYLLSHPKPPLRICHHQHFPPLVSLCLIFFFLWLRHHSYVFRKLLQGSSLWLVAHYGITSPDLSPLVGFFASVACSTYWGSGLAIWISFSCKQLCATLIVKLLQRPVLNSAADALSSCLQCTYYSAL